jgi:hypothetical protein
MTVFVLGAGATRGASFVHPPAAHWNPCQPPLDADFYTQLQRIQNPKHSELVTSVLKDTVELFGSNFDVTLETVFTTLEHTIRMIHTTGESRDFKREDLTKKRTRLMQAIAAVFEESLTQRHEDHATRTSRSCAYHQALVALLRAGDTIITFNYDCLLDYALQQNGNDKWNAHYGYGFQLGSHGTNLSGDVFWQPKDQATKQTTVRLLKLHGSLHFQINGAKVKLKQRPYTQQHGKPHFTIIPPESNKQYDQGVFFRPLAARWGSRPQGKPPCLYRVLGAP